MLRQGRPVDSTFQPEEKLYRRCISDHVLKKRVLPEAFRFPDFSVNRGKYSEPEDVLVSSAGNFGDYAIVVFRVDAIPVRLPSPGRIEYEFRVYHDPQDENYAHSEVRTLKNGVHSRTLDVNKTVKKTFRQMLSDRAEVLKLPDDTRFKGMASQE